MGKTIYLLQKLNKINRRIRGFGHYICPINCFLYASTGRNFLPSKLEFAGYGKGIVSNVGGCEIGV